MSRVLTLASAREVQTSSLEGAGKAKAAGADKPDWVVKEVKPGTGDALPAGFKYIIDESSGQLFEFGLLFMARHYLSHDGKSFKANTVDAYTRDILDWMRYGALYLIPWNKATWEDLANYVDSMGALESPHHGESYKGSTIERRLVPIVKMYSYAAANFPALCVDVPHGSLFEPKNVAEFLDMRRRDRRSKVAFADDSVADTELPNVMEPLEVELVLKAVGPAPRTVDCPEDEEKAESSIGHLGMEFGLQAGLRVSEVVGLRKSLFERFLNATILPNANYRIGTFRRKGGKQKFVRMHGVLVQKVVNYIKRERAHVMKGCKFDHGILLVHKSGNHRGQPLRSGTLQRRFAKACVEAGVTRTVTKLRAEDGDWSRATLRNEERARFTFHDLRHTFAVWTYYARASTGDKEPWMYIQEQLGHEDVATTIKTYLKVTLVEEAMYTDEYLEALHRDSLFVLDEEVDAEVAEDEVFA